MLWNGCGFVRFRHKWFGWVENEGVKTEDVVHCTDGRAHRGDVIVILDYVNKIDLIWSEQFWHISTWLGWENVIQAIYIYGIGSDIWACGEKSDSCNSTHINTHTVTMAASLSRGFTMLPASWQILSVSHQNVSSLRWILCKNHTAHLLVSRVSLIPLGWRAVTMAT